VLIWKLQVYAVALPCIITWHYAIPKRQKIALNVIFSLGLIVVIASCIRTYWLISKHILAKRRPFDPLLTHRQRHRNLSRRNPLRLQSLPLGAIRTPSRHNVRLRPIPTNLLPSLPRSHQSGLAQRHAQIRDHSRTRHNRHFQRESSPGSTRRQQERPGDARPHGLSFRGRFAVSYKKSGEAYAVFARGRFVCYERYEVEGSGGTTAFAGGRLGCEDGAIGYQILMR
jgi:hypothetical protein